ncbi:MAG: ABC transporter permease [Planctomycetaceae bacterium]
MHKLIRFNELALIIAIVIVFCFTATFDSNHSYLTKSTASIADISRQCALLGILAIGSTIVIISGGIDLSAGSMVALGGTVCASLLLMLASPAEMSGKAPLRVWVFAVATIGTLGVGFMVGTLHTWLITSVKLPPFIATLSTLVGLRSFARILCDYATKNFSEGRSASSNIYVSDTITTFIRTNIGISIICWILLLVLTWVLLNLTVLGRHLYAVGGNEQAARLSGIRTDRVKWFAYCFGSITASIAGIFYLADVTVASPVTMAQGHELNAIAASVVGGCSLQGGVGTASGTLLGTIFLRLVVDGVAKLIKSNADVYEGLVVGFVVVLAVTFSQLRQRGASTMRLFAGVQGYFAVISLSLLLAFLTLFIKHNVILAASLGVVILVLLMIWKVVEDQRHR